MAYTIQATTAVSVGTSSVRAPHSGLGNLHVLRNRLGFGTPPAGLTTDSGTTRQGLHACCWFTRRRACRPQLFSWTLFDICLLRVDRDEALRTWRPSSSPSTGRSSREGEGAEIFEDHEARTVDSDGYRADGSPLVVFPDPSTTCSRVGRLGGEPGEPPSDREAGVAADHARTLRRGAQREVGIVKTVKRSREGHSSARLRLSVSTGSPAVRLRAVAAAMRARRPPAAAPRSRRARSSARQRRRADRVPLR
jgi:hypothetical protein